MIDYLLFNALSEVFQHFDSKIVYMNLNTAHLFMKGFHTVSDFVFMNKMIYTVSPVINIVLLKKKS